MQTGFHAAGMLFGTLGSAVLRSIQAGKTQPGIQVGLLPLQPTIIVGGDSGDDSVRRLNAQSYFTGATSGGQVQLDNGPSRWLRELYAVGYECSILDIWFQKQRAGVRVARNATVNFINNTDPRLLGHIWAASWPPWGVQ